MKTKREHRLIPLLTALLLIFPVLFACSAKKEYAFGDLKIQVPASFTIKEYHEDLVLISAGKDKFKTAVQMNKIEASGKVLEFSPEAYAAAEPILQENRDSAALNMTVSEEKVETDTFCGVPAAYARVVGMNTQTQVKCTVEAWKILHGETVYMITALQEDGASETELKELENLMKSFDFGR